MIRYWFLIAIIFAVSCGDSSDVAKSATNETPVDIKGFYALFPPISLPYQASDTGIATGRQRDTISLAVLQQYVPDSVYASLLTNKKAKRRIYPVGSIEKPAETYLLLSVASGNKTTMLSLLFDDQKHFISSLPLLTSGTADGYSHSVSINTEPTFTIAREKTVKDKYSYTKKGYAYSKEARGFIEVINDSNEDPGKNRVVINPIDTLPKEQKYSADYVKDSKNFFSVRDAGTPGKYMFFLHFEKSGSDCSGDLKGTLTMVDATHAVFTQSGDPCVIDFAFAANSVKVKERGSCGNHRGITCMFDDSYRKKKVAAPKKSKK